MKVVVCLSLLLFLVSCSTLDSKNAERLVTEEINYAKPEVIECLKVNKNSEINLQISFKISPEGDVNNTSITPEQSNEVNSCMESIISSLSFPPTENGKAFEIKVPLRIID